MRGARQAAAAAALVGALSLLAIAAQARPSRSTNGPRRAAPHRYVSSQADTLVFESDSLQDYSLSLAGLMDSVARPLEVRLKDGRPFLVEFASPEGTYELADGGRIVLGPRHGSSRSYDARLVLFDSVACARGGRGGFRDWAGARSQPDGGRVGRSVGRSRSLATASKGTGHRVRDPARLVSPRQHRVRFRSRWSTARDLDRL